MPGNDAYPHSAAEALDQLGRLALREHSMESVLQRVADLSKAVMPGHTEASVLLLVKGTPKTIVHTGQLAVDLDEVQFGTGQGPCLNAAATGELTEVRDARTEPRWRRYMVHAAEMGVLSSLSVPLPIEDSTSGALNLYVREAEAFDEESRQAAVRFGPYAAVAIANMHAYEQARDMADNLQLALESRAVIDQAKGILIERHRLTPDQAFQMLAQVSMHANRKLRDIAEDLVETGELPIR
jgi:GAF domain-containing protein